jgi:hypothetical protein
MSLPTPATGQPRWTRLKALFHGALDQPKAEREQWLRNGAAGDIELLHEAQALIEAHETLGTFLEEPPLVEPDDLLDLTPGTRIGSYRIIEEIGRGGMGIVYLAEDERLGRGVALKALPPALAGDPAFRERLRREARAAATISHPAVAVVYSLDEIDGRLLITSEYVRGHTLRSELARGPVEERRAMAIAADIARALAAAHAAGVIHRDLKPENVLITDEGAVKVVDFGIAYVEGLEATRLTRDGGLVGTPAYMAPEQLAGAAVDARADIYAAGVLLAEMVTGRHPLNPAGAPVPTSVATIVNRCVQPDPTNRFATATELLRALDGTARTTAAPHSSSRWWWEFHQAIAALTYWLMVIPVWMARGAIGGAPGRAVFIATLIAVIIAANLRLHLWFTSRFYPAELKWLRARVARAIQGADWLFVIALISGALLIGDERSPLAILLLAFGVGTAVAFLVIEPATTRAAFRSSLK